MRFLGPLLAYEELGNHYIIIIRKKTITLIRCTRELSSQRKLLPPKLKRETGRYIHNLPEKSPGAETAIGSSTGVGKQTIIHELLEAQ